MNSNIKDSITLSANIPSNAVWLGGLGVLPFAAASITASLMPLQIANYGKLALLAYGAVILSFLGGVLWGRILAFGTVEEFSKQTRSLILSVVPSLIGWIAVLSGPEFGLPMLAAAFVLILFIDLLALKNRLYPAWYPKLRIPLTCIVFLFLLFPIALASDLPH